MNDKDSTDEEIIEVLLPVQDLRREITDLRAENERLTGVIERCDKEMDRLNSALVDEQAENERLRAALEDIANVAHPADMRSVNIARRALGRTADYGETR